MRLTQLSLLALASRAVYAYLDTSPFFMFSTSDLLLPTEQITSGSRLTSNLVVALSRCPSDFYLLIKQPGVGLSDFSTPASSPTLSKFSNGATHSTLRSSGAIPDVVGDVDLRTLERELTSTCGAGSIIVDASAVASSTFFDSSPQVISLELSPPSESQPERSQDILDHDSSLSSLFDMLSNRNYTIIYTTTPKLSTSNPANPQEQYEMMSDYTQPLHTDLKRDIHPEPFQSTSNETLVDGPLFERYQFLSPGLFMGLLVSFLLLSILYVAISGVASLQVTYAAFDKENGPTAQKKGQ